MTGRPRYAMLAAPAALLLLLGCQCCKGSGPKNDPNAQLPAIQPDAQQPAPQTATLPAGATLAAGRPDSFSGIIKKMKDVVVTIKAKQVVSVSPGFPFGLLTPYEHPQVRSGLGSGFIIDKKGLIVTNNHVIENASEIMVQFADKHELPAGLVGRDERLDIAVLRIPEPVSLEAALGDSDKLEVGDWVLAIGNPLGLANTVTAGIVSAKGRSATDLWGEIPGYADFIQTDASINPGNSGGPLVNLGAEVVAVNTAIVKEGQGIGFAIPINMVKQVLPQLVKDGRITRSWLGLVLASINEELAASLQMAAARGALVAEVVRDSPAEDAGLKPGDVILSFAGQEISDAGKLRWVIATSPAGTPLKVKIWRDGKEQEREVSLRPMPERF